MINSIVSSMQMLLHSLNNDGYGMSFVQPEYDSYTDCDGGCDDDYCRCSRIDNARIETIKEDNLLFFVAEHIIAAKQQLFQQTPSEVKCAQAWLKQEKNPLLNILKDMGFLNTYQYRVEVDSDPYGETIGGVYFDDTQALERLKYHILKVALLTEPTDMTEHLQMWAREEAPAVELKSQKTFKIKKI